MPVDTTYPSKRDLWIVLLLWFSVAMSVFGVVSLWTEPEGQLTRAWMTVLLVAAVGFILWLLYGTRYTLTSRELIVRAGPFRWRVPLESIREITPTHNPLSSPAVSLDRLHIRHGKSGEIMISPDDKRSFLRDLVARAPHLAYDGTRVTVRSETF